MLFENEIREASDKLYKKGYYTDRMIYDDSEFEVSDNNGKVVIDHLSIAQLLQLSELLNN